MKCNYCGHDLSDANPVQYINGEPLCLKCQCKIQGADRNVVNPLLKDVTADDIKLIIYLLKKVKGTPHQLISTLNHADELLNKLKED